MIIPGILASGHGVETGPTITSNGGGPTATIHTLTGSTAVTTVAATGDAPISYSIAGGADQALFQINAATGVLSYKVASLAGDHVVVVRASNAYGHDDQTITSSIGVVPVITSNGGGPTAIVAVTAPATAVTTVAATGTAPITYSKNGGADQALFDINASTGVLAFHAASSAGSYVVIVEAANAWGNDTQTITVNVT